MLVHAGALGDFVLSLRVLAALREAGAHGLTILGRPTIAVLATIDGQADRVVDFETGGFHALFQRELPLLASATNQIEGHELVINMAAAESPVFSQRLADVTGGRVIDLDPRPRAGRADHITEQWLEDLGRSGLAPTTSVSSIRLSPRALPAKILIHPGSGGRRKCWPLERFLALAVALRAENRAIEFLIGPTEDESWSPDEISGMEKIAPVVRGKPLVEVAEMLAGAEHVVANDSGIAHLAAAVKTRLAVIFGPTDPRRWRPLGPDVAVLAGQPWPEVIAVLAAIDAPVSRR